MKFNGQIQTAKDFYDKHWSFGNKILYDMCKKYFVHKRDEVILTKVLFIGRIYAAAIERRKNKSKSNINNDNFYIKKVAPAFRTSSLDKQLAKLKKLKTLSSENILQVLKVHYSLMKTLSKITDLNKRSFSSKHLHFHLPELFFIYDSRAKIGLSNYQKRVPKQMLHFTRLKTVDKEYANFFCKCFALKYELANQNQTVTNRQLDNLLIMVANGK